MHRSLLLEGVCLRSPIKMQTEFEESRFNGPSPYALADWRRRVNDIYSVVRMAETPQSAWRFWHFARSALFRDHPMSPVSAAAKSQYLEIEVFDYDPEFRFSVDLEPVDAGAITFNLADEGIMQASVIAETSGLKNALGSELTVYWIGGYGGGLFIPFKDASCGEETYGGGRYIVDAIKGADLGLDEAGKLILDFNFAYNPSCALSDAYICPLSPEQNRLSGKILAGEKTQTWLNTPQG